MTVCIAAICDTLDLDPDVGPKIVLCTDNKGSGPLGSKESVLKDRILTKYWRCLTAGSEDDLNALVPKFKRHIRQLKPVDETTIGPALRAAMQERKLEKANEYTLSKWGMPYEAFRKAKDQFPEDQFRADMFEISQLSLSVDCIVAGFLDDGTPMLLQVDGQAVKIREDFAVAGEGAYLAQSVMMHREHYETIGLSRTLYCVYEAKKYAERVASVGKSTFIAMYGADGSACMLKESGREILDAAFVEFGPRDIGEIAEIAPSHFLDGRKLAEDLSDESS